MSNEPKDDAAQHDCFNCGDACLASLGGNWFRQSDIDAAVAAEREACAKVVEYWVGVEPIADAIRARSVKPLAWSDEGTRAMSADEAARHEQTRREEREACAQSLEASRVFQPPNRGDDWACGWQMACDWHAAAIRRRGAQPTSAAPPVLADQTREEAKAPASPFESPRGGQ